MAFILFALTIYVYGLNCYFFQENFTGSAIQNLRILFTAGTSFILKGFSGWTKPFRILFYQPLFMVLALVLNWNY
jgi:hypothetical protein